MGRGNPKNQRNFIPVLIIGLLLEKKHVFFSWYPWIPGQVSVYVVGRVWHQPNFALAAWHGGCVYYTLQRAQASFMRAACRMPHAACRMPCPRAAIFIIMFPPFWDRNLGRAYRAEKKARRQCKLLPWKATFLRASRQSLRASTAIAVDAVDAVCNFRAASQVTA